MEKNTSSVVIFSQIIKQRLCAYCAVDDAETVSEAVPLSESPEVEIEAEDPQTAAPSAAAITATWRLIKAPMAREWPLKMREKAQRAEPG